MSHAVIRSEEQIEALGDEFQRLDAAYALCARGYTFAMFVARPWYFRNLTELLHDGDGFRLLLPRQRAVRMRADAETLRRESRTRLHNGAIFEPLHHHARHRGTRIEFNRKLHP